MLLLLKYISTLINRPNVYEIDNYFNLLRLIYWKFVWFSNILYTGQYTVQFHYRVLTGRYVFLLLWWHFFNAWRSTQIDCNWFNKWIKSEQEREGELEINEKCMDLFDYFVSWLTIVVVVVMCVLYKNVEKKLKKRHGKSSFHWFWKATCTFLVYQWFVLILVFLNPNFLFFFVNFSCCHWALNWYLCDFFQAKAKKTGFYFYKLIFY